MNERILKLSIAAKKYALTKPDIYQVAYDKKFAKLIVQECIGVCLDRHNTWRWDNELDSDSGPRDCARSIQEHFGVKE